MSATGDDGKEATATAQAAESAEAMETHAEQPAPFSADVHADGCCESQLPIARVENGPSSSTTSEKHATSVRDQGSGFEDASAPQQQEPVIFIQLDLSGDLETTIRGGEGSRLQKKATSQTCLSDRKLTSRRAKIGTLPGTTVTGGFDVHSTESDVLPQHPGGLQDVDMASTAAAGDDSTLLGRKEQHSLLAQGLLFSVSFGVLEGCITATLAIAHAVVPASYASYSSALLYCAFALSTLVSPAVVARAGAKRAMVGAMAAYTLYVAAFIVPTLATLVAGGVIGGVAGGVLWTAQGVYLTRLAVEYARRGDGDGDEMSDGATHAEARAARAG
eukprot:6179603-Pleurochrysis_carterae.AAC.1